MAILTGEQILAANDRAFEDVECSEWGGTVRVRVMGASVRRLFERRLGEVDKDPSIDTRTLLTGACACDESLNYLFVKFDEHARPEFAFDQLKALAVKSNLPITRLFAAAKRLNLIGDAEDDAGKK